MLVNGSSGLIKHSKPDWQQKFKLKNNDVSKTVFEELFGNLWSIKAIVINVISVHMWSINLEIM